MVIPKEDVLFKTRPKPKVNVQSCVGLVDFQSLVGLRLLLGFYLYELGVNGAKSVNGNR